MKKLIFILLMSMFLISFIGAVETFTPIFCNDYEFTCCNEKDGITQSYSITDELAWTCPSYAYKCKLLNGITIEDDWYVGSSNCHLDTGFCDWWKCDNEVKSTTEMNSENQIYLRNNLCLNVQTSAEIKIIKKQLNFCGTSGCTVGVPISADDCTFSPNLDTVYTSLDSITGKVTTTSYTTPIDSCVLAFQSGNRHICGYKEASCSSNSDCTGHTYGNKECVGRTLQEYGCKSYGTQIEGQDRGPFSSGWGSDKPQPTSGNADFGKRCEIIKSESVQCCGDTDCGSGMFCDISTFTCQKEIKCKEDSDCGVSVQCDWTTNFLKTPSCKSGRCQYEEKVVGCCLDKNCEEGSFCNEKKECEVGSKSKSQELENSVSGITGNVIGNSASSTGTIIFVVFLVLIGGSIAYFIFNKNKTKNLKQQVKEDIKIGGKYCTKCGSLLRGGNKFCTKCGRKSS